MSPPAIPSSAPAGPSWNTYKQSIGDRSSLFRALVESWPVTSALYLGSYLDLSPSAAIESVTYVDTDRRAARFFANRELVMSELNESTPLQASHDVAFLLEDFTAPLSAPDASFDLVIALYTGPAWDHCLRYLKPGGLFLANSSHGDASLAALDPRTSLVGAIHYRGGRYTIERDHLDGYLIPTKPKKAEAHLIRSSGRGIGYTKSAFAYLFEVSS